MTTRNGRPRLLIIGGPDVHLRIGLMSVLRNEYEVIAAGSDPHLEDTFVQAGFGYHHYPLGRGVEPKGELRSLWALESLVRRLDPDIVHTFATKPGIWGRIAARRAGIRAVIGTLPGLGSLYSSTVSRRHRFSKRIYESLQKYASDCSNMTVFQNSEDLAHFLERGIVTAEKSRVIPGSGVSTEYFDRSKVDENARNLVRSELSLPAGSLVVTMVSRVMRTKGVMEFADVARAIRLRRSDVEFLLVGTDDQGSIDRLDARERQTLGTSVRWLGHRSDVREILAISDLFVLPTYYREGMPRALLEAASMSLPLITTKIPGCESVVVPGECGAMVRPRDAFELRQAIEGLLDSSDLRLRMGIAARDRVLRHYDLPVIAKHTASLYEEALGTSRGLPSQGVGNDRKHTLLGATRPHRQHADALHHAD